MTRSIHHRLIQAILVGSLLCIAVAPAAFAQEEQQQSMEPKSTRRIRLDGVCADSIARFCPALIDSPGQTLSQVTCLKPYRTSLPLSCRRAVTAALK